MILMSNRTVVVNVRGGIIKSLLSLLLRKLWKGSVRVKDYFLFYYFFVPYVLKIKVFHVKGYGVPWGPWSTSSPPFGPSKTLSVLRPTLGMVRPTSFFENLDFFKGKNTLFSKSSQKWSSCRKTDDYF